MAMWIIEDWFVTSPNTMYDPPEVMTFMVVGRCPNRQGFEDAIRTSPIVKVEGRRIWTQNGSRYVLGRPDPKYVEYCKARKCHVPTRKHPIKVHTLGAK